MLLLLTTYVALAIFHCVVVVRTADAVGPLQAMQGQVRTATLVKLL